MSKTTFWTRTNILLLALFIEHLIIALKVVIALIIPDVPKNVKDSEKRRREFVLIAQQQIEKCKKESGMQDIAELMTQKALE